LAHFRWIQAEANDTERRAHPDLAEALQARLRANRDAETAAEDKRLRVEGLEAQVVTCRLRSLKPKH
jgi:hypothetical protein